MTLLLGTAIIVTVDGALEILRREREAAAEQIRVLRVQIRDLDAAIAVLDEQPQAARVQRQGGDLKLSVLKLVEQARATGATPKALADQLTAAGRATGDASVASTLSRLKGEGKVINRQGRWFAASGSSPDADALRRDSSWDDVDDDVPF